MQKILDKINEIINQRGKSIVILKGFDISQLPKEKKYFSFDIKYYDQVNLETAKELVIDEIIINRTFDDDFRWMTIEEYQLFKQNQNINKMPIFLIQNNLYYAQFPYRKTLSNIENIYQELYYQEDVELNEEQLELHKKVTFFYGKIDYSKNSGIYYVTYPEEKNLRTFNLHEEIAISVDLSQKFPQQNVQRLELSDDEIPFLDLENEILANKSKANVIFVLNRDSSFLPNKYLERLNILSSLSDVNFYFTTSSIKRQIIENEKEYLKILKDTYEYDNFREIEFYKNIGSRDPQKRKETINISQVQLIDDIVSQAEKALTGETFRDMYITAATGAGKSIMFQIPSLYLSQKYSGNKPLTLVISPLIGLMNDQVESLKRKGVRTSATINGNTPPYEKERILEKIQSQEVNTLYLSPETLQSRSDIKMLIGDRNIGVVIIDEAHIVTTWGKSFRADYWYLGIYLAKLRKQYKFPIVTFTATAIYGGQEDMYLDTRNSLNMISPISYFGNIRRSDIYMLVKNSEKEFDSLGRDYRKTKHTLALKHLILATKKKEKSLLYFPTIRLLNEFYNFIVQNKPEIAEKTGKYYGSLSKEEKDEVLREYKNGDLQFVLATKAFGMGIDIPDITNVYHYAPTGSVVDYIQEIGRVARDKGVVKDGYGIIDFLPRDINEVKQLYGMSAIRKSQILEVMKKVVSIYHEKGHNRNLIISPEDFKYIFVQNKRDEDTLDNKVKTVLLMIEKDFESPKKLGYSPFVARPRSLYGNDLIFATPELEAALLKSRLNNFFFKVASIEGKGCSSVYQVNMSGIWEKYYKNMSYPSFKYLLHSGDGIEKLKHKNLFKKFEYTTGVELTLNNDFTVKDLLSEYRKILRSFEDFSANIKILGNQFTVEDLGKHFKRTLKISDKFEARAFAQTIINAAFEFGKIRNRSFIHERSNSTENNQRYILRQDADVFSKFIMDELLTSTHPTTNYIREVSEITTFYNRSQGDTIDAKIAALGIGEARGLINYQVLGGNNPQIYLRVNSIFPIEKAIKEGDFYQNRILTDVQKKHYTSVAMLKYLFTQEQTERNAKDRIINYTDWFWNQIEDYFMGILPDEVKDDLSMKS
ncbi:helicase-related protein [Aerococcus urinaeequi]|uniref:helicase-related protein n=1 Tax=Aerococcus urinaeequi TaxID=51665 RepID=UPI003EC5A8F2